MVDVCYAVCIYASTDAGTCAELHAPLLSMIKVLSTCYVYRQSCGVKCNIVAVYLQYDVYL